MTDSPPEPAPRDPFQSWFAPFERMIEPFADDARQRPPGELFPFLRWGLGRARWAVVALGVASLAVGASEAGLFWLIGGLVDRATAAGPEGFWTEEWPWLVAFALVVIVAKPVTTLAQNALGSLTLQPGLHPMTIFRLHRHTLGQSMRFFEEDFTGRLAQKQMQTANALTSATTEALTALGMLISYVVTMTVVLAVAHPALGAVALVWVGFYAASLNWALPLIRGRAKARAEARASVTGRLVDSLSHIRTVKLFAHAGREEESARQALQRYRDAALGFGRPLMGLRTVLAFLNAGVTVLMIGLALGLWSAGVASIGVVAMAAMLTLRLTQMSNWIAMTAMSIFGELGTLEDGAKTLSPEHEITDPPAPRALPRVEGRVSFEGATFRYGREVGGVKALDLEIAPGEKVGLVGRSGAGKSTAVSLLLRLYDVEEGRVAIDGVDLRDMAQDDIRRAVATVTQETAIFNRSTLDNILYGRPDAGFEAAEEAARRASAHEFIKDIRDGRGRTDYRAHLGERGVKLSGGQKQRIALARAILKDAPILVLDEATSALDSEVEAEIQDALREVMRGKTVLAIAHRLSTIAAMDRIVVMDHGRVVEQGPHDALLAQGGLYAELWSRQSGGFLLEAAE